MLLQSVYPLFLILGMKSKYHTNPVVFKVDFYFKGYQLWSTKVCYLNSTKICRLLLQETPLENYVPYMSVIYKILFYFYLTILRG